MIILLSKSESLSIHWIINDSLFQGSTSEGVPYTIGTSGNKVMIGKLNVCPNKKMFINTRTIRRESQH